MDAGELIYDAKVQLTNVVEFGANLQAIVAGKAAPPPEGGRFDGHFEGTVTGPKLKGSVKGIDYVNMRPDGRVELHIHAQIDTADGAKVSFYGDGVGTLDPTGVLHLRENVSMKSHAPEYKWVNTIQIWATGSANLTTGEIKVSGYKV